MPTFNNGETGLSVRNKINKAINLTDRVMIVDDVTQLANLVYDINSQWGVAAGMQVLTAREGFSYDVLASGATAWDIQPGAVKLNLLPGDDGFFNFRGMLPAANGTTDDYPLLEKLLAKGDAPAGSTRQGPSIFFPPGNYRMNSTIELKATTNFKGAVGYSAGNFAVLVFAENTTGIVINRADTLNGGVVSTTTGADATTIDGVAITSLGGTDATKCGIWARARFSLRSCAVTNFPGHGIQVIATCGGTGAERGNANVFLIENVLSKKNGRNGLFVDGDCANGGVIINLDTDQNGRHGIQDTSFLGNTYIACHSATNGKPGSGYNAAGQSNGVSFDGKYWLAHWNATDAQLVATQPGTNANVWIDTGLTGAPNSDNPLWTAGRPEGTFFAAYAYLTNNVNASNVFLGCYNELDGWCAFIGPTVVLGGTMVNTIQGSRLAANGQGQYFINSMGFGQAGWGVTMTDGTGAMTISNPTTSLPWRLQQQGTNLVMRNGNLGSRDAFFLLGDGSNTPYKFGVADWVINGYREGVRTAAPTTEFWPTGSYIRNGNVASGQPRGWRCTVGGTPGTWVADSNWP